MRRLRNRITVLGFALALGVVAVALIMVSRPANAPVPPTEISAFAAAPTTLSAGLSSTGTETAASQSTSGTKIVMTTKPTAAAKPTEPATKKSTTTKPTAQLTSQTTAKTTGKPTAQPTSQTTTKTTGKPTAQPTAKTTAATTTSVAPIPSAPSGEVRAAWISYLELTLGSGMSQAAFRQKYAALFDQLRALELNAVFVHVRPFADSIYPSDVFPWSEILTGKQGQNPGYDPLEVLCSLAKERGLALHAWINPFRAARTADITKLCAQSPTLKHLNANDNWVKRANGQYFWNPAELQAHQLIYDGVREILRRYDVAGVHIDDYFYPTTEKAFDAADYAAYQGGGGSLSLADWRRGLISRFVRGLYEAVKAERPGAVVSISPAASLDGNYGALYADCRRWMKEQGYCDWMIPQVYFGFEHKSMAFDQVARQWAGAERHGGCALLFGLAAYKIGKEDANAGAGKTEWVEQHNLLARQVQCARGQSGYGGFAIYSATGLLSNFASSERENLQKLLK